MTNLWPLCISPTKLRQNKKRPKHPSKKQVFWTSVSKGKMSLPRMTPRASWLSEAVRRSKTGQNTRPVHYQFALETCQQRRCDNSASDGLSAASSEHGQKRSTF